MRIRAKIVATVLALLVTTHTLAHPMPQSRVELHILESKWTLRLLLPANRLEAAINLADPNALTVSLDNNGIKTPGESKLNIERIKRYIKPRILVSCVGASTQMWPLSIVDATLLPHEQAHVWNVLVQLTPPTSACSESVEMQYHVIGQEIHTHESTIVLMQDDLNSTISNTPAIIARLRAHRKKVLIKR